MTILWQYIFKTRLLKALEPFHIEDEFARPQVKISGLLYLINKHS